MAYNKDRKYKTFTYFCGCCSHIGHSHKFEAKLALNEKGFIMKGQTVVCPKCKNFVKVLSFI